MCRDTAQAFGTLDCILDCVPMLPPEWSTRRLSLRPPRAEDAKAIFQGWATDATVTRYLSWRPHRRLEDTREFVERCVEAWRGTTRGVWLITHFGERPPIGTIELRVTGHSAELGYALARPAWGRGIKRQAWCEKGTCDATSCIRT